MEVLLPTVLALCQTEYVGSGSESRSDLKSDGDLITLHGAEHSEGF